MEIRIILGPSGLFIFLSSCAGYEKTKSQKSDNRIYYSSNGFALVYEDDHYLQKIVNKKINNDDIKVMHNFLKKNFGTQIIKNPKFFFETFKSRLYCFHPERIYLSDNSKTSAKRSEIKLKAIFTA